MNAPPPLQLERALILAPRGRDALVARDILLDAQTSTVVCRDLEDLLQQLRRGADLAIVTEEALRGDTRALAGWVGAQPPWSDFPFIVLTKHGGGVEWNPEAAKLTAILGNVSFLERPFHPTTLVSVVQTNMRGRRRQYECRRLNEDLEIRVQDRTAELAAANRQLVAQIEERERVESTLRQMQRLEAVGQLTSGVAHDFNNLLTVVLGNIGFIERAMERAGIDGKTAQRLGYMRAAAERGAKLTDQLLSFSRRQRLEPKVLDLNDTITGMRDLLQSTIGGSVHIETRLGENLWPALVDPTQHVRDVVFSGLGHWRIAFDGTFKIIAGFDPSKKAGAGSFTDTNPENWRLVRVGKDPAETEDLTSRYPEIAARLKTLLQAEVARVPRGVT